MAKWPYNTAAWKRVRAVKLSEAPLCEYCPPGRVTPATQVDHAVAIADGGGPFDMSNLRSSCQACHSRKTASLDRGFGNRKRPSVPVPGCHADGQPLDPAHWWNRPAGKISRS